METAQGAMAALSCYSAFAGTAQVSPYFHFPFSNFFFSVPL
jgi:hypothetical protein